MYYWVKKYQALRENVSFFELLLRVFILKNDLVMTIIKKRFVSV